MTAPTVDLNASSFALIRDGLAHIGTAPSRMFDTVSSAREALADGSVEVVTGALGFDTGALAALTAPARFLRDVPVSSISSSEPLRAQSAHALSQVSAEQHGERIQRALTAIGSGGVDKVVLARAAQVLLERPADPASIISSFITSAPCATTFAAALDPAPDRDGCWLIGASPELLVRRSGRIVTCHPLAGSAPRHPDPVADREVATRLLTSDKDLHEHAFVVDYLREQLEPLCCELDVPGRPELTSTGELWHLATPIRGVLSDDSLTALDLAAALSPTPAVCGTPTASAARLIEALESPRDFYAGTVGWCDGDGDGEWLVSIRCLELAADHRTVTTWAGGGIVAGSHPDQEIEETVAKFRTVHRALGLA